MKEGRLTGQKNSNATSRPRIVSILLLVGSAIGLDTAGAQVDYGARLGETQAGIRSFGPQGPVVLMETVSPTMRRWYVPQELQVDYAWRNWETTNYARDPYYRYVGEPQSTKGYVEDPAGDVFYDLYGNLLTQGWLLYNASQTSPTENGHRIVEASRMNQWFSGVAVASEGKGQYRYALTVGRDIRTTLTPLVFSKARYNGVQLDFMTNKYKATLLYSQGAIGWREEERPRTDVTNIIGGRLVAQVGDFVELGVHMANAHQSNSQSEQLVDNMISGNIPEIMNQEVTRIEVVLRDDSPEDEDSGATFFPAGSDIIITYVDGQRDTGKDIRFEPVVQGGVPGQGFLGANGNDEIRLTYDLTDPSFVARAHADRSEIAQIEFRMTLANDYQIWVTSDQQNAPLMVERAEGNVKDGSNLTVVEFEYGLPTATHLVGGSLRVSDVLGFDLYGEYDLSWSYHKFPNPLTEKQEGSSGIRGKRARPAWMLNVGKQAGRLFLYGETYSIDPLYNTQTFVTDLNGNMSYSVDRFKYDMVDDNDDQDRQPDLPRYDTFAQGSWDLRVFPGWDRNRDFIPDYNQNDNRVNPNSFPDYEEPFLRFESDRPEFLLGVDMNHNYWVDHFENDNEPDYPYPRDHRGFNAFGTYSLTPELEVTAGVLREESIASARRNHSDYGMVRFMRSGSRWGRLRLFGMLQSVRDDIPDDLWQWRIDQSLLLGGLTEVKDPLLARDTWVSQSFAGHHWQRGAFFVQSKLNFIRFSQRLNAQERTEYGVDESDFFFGLINKASYTYRLGPLELVPRWKSEYVDHSRTLFDDGDRTVLTELFSGLAFVPLLTDTRLQAGVEYLVSRDLNGRAEDFNSRSIGLQVTTNSAYQGYSMLMATGFSVERLDPRDGDPSTTVQSFISIYAGLEQGQ